MAIGSELPRRAAGKPTLRFIGLRRKAKRGEAHASMQRQRAILRVLLPAWMSIAVGCDDTAETTATGGSSSASTTSTAAATSSASTGGGAAAGIGWTPCPIITDGAGVAAECAVLDVPADYAKPAGGDLQFSVKRILATNQPAKAQIWFMNGGPGGSVVDFEPIAEYLHDFDETLDLYMPEHRGVGLSSRMSCPKEELPTSDGGRAVTLAEMPACIQYLLDTWGERLAGFTAENAARDLGETIAKTRAPGQDVFVYGISYGSHWGNRYLQLYPEQATGVALGALAVNFSFTVIDQRFNELGERYMAACGADAFCASKLGPDPWARMTALMQSLDAGHCSEVQALGLDRAIVRQLASSLLYAWDDRTIIPPLVYRLERCSAADVNAITFLVDTLVASASGTPSASERNTSILLGDHIGLSEMWAEPAPPQADLEAFVATANVSGDVSTEMGALRDIWPRYTPNPSLAGKVAATSIPILLQNGAYDFIRSADYQPVVDAFMGPHQSFVEYPRATHDPWTAATAAGGSCGLIDFYYFVQDPTKAPDPKCLGFIVPFDFTVDSAYASAYFGAADAWEGDPGPQANAVARSDSALRRAVKSRIERGAHRAVRSSKAKDPIRP
jgi:pimeloyl-ACP methyl ester carboxylesterase